MTRDQFYKLIPGDILTGHNGTVWLLILSHINGAHRSVHTQIMYGSGLSSWPPGATHVLFVEYCDLYDKVESLP